jgi:hypothetical protein
MGIDLCRPHVTAPEQLLNRAAEENLFRAGALGWPTRLEQEENAPGKMLKKFVQQGRSE